MNALVFPCLRPSKMRMPIEDDEDGSTILSPSSLPHERSDDEYQIEELETNEEDQESLSTSTPEECSPPRLKSDVLQSPSRLRVVPIVTTTKIPLFYSPLAEGYQGTANVAALTKLNAADLISYENRWDYQSSLAGCHQQSLYVLDLSHRPLHPATLKFGVTPEMAQKITDFRFDKDSVGRHDLPSLLDVIINLFPQLKHLTLKCQSKCQIANGNADKTFDLKVDEGRVFSADGSEDERSLGDAKLLAKFDANIAMAQRENERIERLYLLYRMPSLSSINGLLVTEEERKVARPDTPLGHKVKNYEWVNHANLLSGTEMNVCCTDEQSDDSDFSEEEEGGRAVPLNSMINRMRSGQSSPELLDSIRAERQRLSSLPTSGSSSNACSNERIKVHGVMLGIQRIDPKRKSLLRMFPRTGKSIATKSNIFSPRKQNQVLSNIGSDISYSSNSNGDSVVICASNDATSIGADSDNNSGRGQAKETEIETNDVIVISVAPLPNKQNLDAFLQKENCAIRYEASSKIAVPQSEATDAAIAISNASRLLMNFEPKVVEKDNLLASKHPKKADKCKNNLIGSMVNVKTKNQNATVMSLGPSSRPPPSPASAIKNYSLRSFPRAMLKRKKEVKRRNMIPSVSLVDDDDDDDDDISNSS